MSVKGQRLPSERSLLAAVDQAARNAVKAAQAEVAPLVSANTPRRSGRTAAALRPRVTRTQAGAALLVAAPRGAQHGKVRIAQVVRWVNRGTGLYRTTGLDVNPAHKIRARRRGRRMILPGGRKVWSVKGQKPNPFIDRIRLLGTPRFERACQRGTIEIERAVERTIR